MKKIFYLLASLMLVFTACDPMEDVYEELDKISKDKTTVETELVKADYDYYKKDANYPHVASKQYFTDEAEAAALIPAILNKKYAHLANGATVTVTYNTPVFAGISNEVSSWVAYTVTDEDYTANGEKFSNFNSSGDFSKFLNTKYSNPVEKQLVVLTYNYYAGGTTYNDITDSFYYLNGKWENIYHVTSNDYASVNNLYKSFSGSDSQLMPVYFDKFLKNEVYDAKAGDLRYVSYYFYNSGSRDYSQRIMAMYFNGTDWVPAVGATQEAVLKFQKKDNVWVPDLSIQYTLTADDYAYVGNDANNIATAAARENLRRFGNFSTYNWTTDQLYEAMNAVLKLHFSNEEEGKKFKVTFESYPAGKMELVLIKRANGEFTKPLDGE